MDWLSATGSARKEAVESAAQMLLAEYRRKWATLMPVELHRLAASINAKISPVEGVAGGARLMPVAKGFLVLVDSNLPAAKRRMSIAHELAHILFYDTKEGMPVRKQVHTKAEEHFCFDVGRRLLAPDWVLEQFDLRNSTDPRCVFETLSTQLKLSRPVAAQVMFRDRCFFSGFAGTWQHMDRQWRIRPGRFWTSPNFNRRELTRMKELCKAWLDSPSTITGNITLWAYRDGPDGSQFVVVTTK
jgi:IrrE N-terminal-like domain